MKIILMALSLLMSTSVFAKPEFICSLLNAKKVIPIAEVHSDNDKNRHCTVSCMLTLRCDSSDVLMAGVLKEIRDFFGNGTPDREDIEADKRGIDLAYTQAAKNNQECLNQCDLYYAE